MLAVTLGLVLQSTPVTFESPGIRLSDLVREFGTQLGTSLRTSDELAEDSVSIVVEKRPWSEVSTHLARVTNATWTLEDGALMLRQTKEQISHDNDQRRKNLGSKIDLLRRSFPSSIVQKDWTLEDAKQWELAEANDLAKDRVSILNRGPMGRFMARILATKCLESAVDSNPTFFDRRFVFGNAYLGNETLPAAPDSLLAKLSNELHLLDRLVGTQPRFPATRRAHLMLCEYGIEFIHAEVSTEPLTIRSFHRLFGGYGEVAQRQLEVANDKEESPLRTLAPALEFAHREFWEPPSPETVAALKELQSGKTHWTAYAGGRTWLKFAKGMKRPMIALLSQAYMNEVVKKDSGFATDGPIRIDSGEWILCSNRDLWRVRHQRVSQSEFLRFMNSVVRKLSPPEDQFQDVRDQLEYRRWLYLSMVDHLESLFPPLPGSPHYPDGRLTDVAIGFTAADWAVLQRVGSLKLSDLSLEARKFLHSVRGRRAIVEDGSPEWPPSARISVTFQAEPRFLIEAEDMISLSPGTLSSTGEGSFDDLARTVHAYAAQSKEDLIKVQLGEAVCLRVRSNENDEAREDELYSRARFVSPMLPWKKLSADLQRRLRVRGAALARDEDDRDSGR